MLAIGRALMSRPKLILLDEPSMGLAPVMVLRLFDLIRRVREEGYTILVVEQNVRQVLKLVDRAYLLEVGRIKMEGRAAELAEQDFVRKAYVGLSLIDPIFLARGGDQRDPAGRRAGAARARAEPDLRRARHRLDRLRGPRDAVHVRRLLPGDQATAGRSGWPASPSIALGARARRRRAPADHHAHPRQPAGEPAPRHRRPPLLPPVVRHVPVDDRPPHGAPRRCRPSRSAASSSPSPG